MRELTEGFVASIHGLYNAVISKDPERALSFCTEDVVVTWGPYTFKGKEEIRRWIMDLGRHFKEVKLENISIVQKEDSVVHRFNIWVSLSNGQRGWLPAEGKYEFKKGRFHRVWINPTRGYILIKRRDFS